MRIFSQRLLRFGSIFTPSFFLRSLGKKTFIEQVDSRTKLKMRGNSYDMAAINHVWRKREYASEDFIIRPGDVVIDIGAHIGAFSVWAARQAASGRVYAFEPNDENYRLLEENKKLNDLTNLETFKLAVSDKAGEAVLFNSERRSLAHSLFEVGEGHHTVVRTISLAEILLANQIDRVNYLKIDAEGAEYLVVLNTPSKILCRIDKIFIEYHDYLHHGHNYEDLKKYLAENGFQVETGGGAYHRHILKMGFLKARSMRL